MPKPNKTQIKLAFLKQLLEISSTPEGICASMRDSGVVPKKGNESKNTSLTKRITDQLQEHFTTHHEPIENISKLLDSEKYKSYDEKQRNGKISSANQEVSLIGKMEDGLVMAYRVIGQAYDLFLERLSYREMIAVTGLIYQAKQLLTDTPSTETSDTTSNAVIEYFRSLSSGPTDRNGSEKQKVFRAEMDAFAKEEIQALFSGDISLLESDTFSATSGFKSALEGRIEQLEMLAEQESREEGKKAQLERQKQAILKKQQILQQKTHRNRIKVALFVAGVATLLSLLAPLPAAAFYSLLIVGLLLVIGVVVEHVVGIYRAKNKEDHLAIHESIQLDGAEISQFYDPRDSKSETSVSRQNYTPLNNGPDSPLSKVALDSEGEEVTAVESTTGNEISLSRKDEETLSPQTPDSHTSHIFGSTKGSATPSLASLAGTSLASTFGTLQQREPLLSRDANNNGVRKTEHFGTPLVSNQTT